MKDFWFDTTPQITDELIKEMRNLLLNGDSFYKKPIMPSDYDVFIDNGLHCTYFRDTFPFHPDFNEVLSRKVKTSPKRVSSILELDRMIVDGWRSVNNEYRKADRRIRRKGRKTNRYHY